MKFRTPALPLTHPASLLATWFGAGLMPYAPGTWGSFAALPLAWLILHFGGIWHLAAATVAVSLIGWWAAAQYIRAMGREDPGDVVIDEVAGQWLTLLAAGDNIGPRRGGQTTARYLSSSRIIDWLCARCVLGRDPRNSFVVKKGRFGGARFRAGSPQLD